MFDFQNLNVYQKSKTFHLNCKQIILEPKTDKYVRDQLRRASHSIILNIAEGSAKSTKADRRNYFTIARASVFECVAIIDIMQTEQKLNKDQYNNLLSLANEISKMLFTMIQNLQG
jgi:four helix bundle protein